jgi:hypothetical protein
VTAATNFERTERCGTTTTAALDRTERRGTTIRRNTKKKKVWKDSMLSVSGTRCSLYYTHPIPGVSGNGLLDTGSPLGGGEEGLAIAAVVGTIRCGTGGSSPHNR